MGKTYEAPSNEAPHMILGYHQGRLMTYLFFDNGKRLSQEPLVSPIADFHNIHDVYDEDSFFH